MRITSLWDPFSEIGTLQKAVNRLFEDFSGKGDVSYPPVNVCDMGDSYVVSAVVPGLKKEDVNLTAMGNTLTIQGEKKAPEVQHGNFYRRERGFGKFHKVVEFPTDVDTEKVKAKYENGILTVATPKAESAKPRQISIDAS
jgi:HSP20 family protein